MDYKMILASIARDKGLPDLAAHIESFSPKEIVPELTDAVGIQVFKYNITKLPEATCEGCQ